ncbi:MAG TPA: hypothetical protein VGM86_31510 [Thermoanaerobaculia bacterium]
MALTAEHWLEVLATRLVEPLFEPETVRRLHRLAVTLPGECQGTLETRLAPGAAPVDLSLRLRAADEARDMAVRLPSMKGFLLRWAEGALAPVRSVWLEFDLDREPDGAGSPAPVVCAKLPRETDPGWLTGTLLPALQGRPLPAGQRASILSCLDALPAAASLLYVFSLRSRGSDAIRLEIFGLEPAAMLTYLRSLAPEMVPAVEEVSMIFAGVERLHLSFDVTDAILPRIGIEGSFPRQPSREPRWGALFESLVRRGLCSPEKRDAALAWPGYDTFWTAPERWPVDAIGPRGFCVRALSHLKVVCRPDREPEAKAYLTFGVPDLSNEGATASSAASRSAFST